jgi:hypothetical protein
MSVCLQLAGFINIIATALWIDKIGYGSVHQFAKNMMLYSILSIVTASVGLVGHAHFAVTYHVCIQLQFPWMLSVRPTHSMFLLTTNLDLLQGWTSIRRERRKLFLAFCAMGCVLFGITTFIFCSTLYHFVFASWSFFATITVGGYIFLVMTSLLGILCRFHFGHGLAHYRRRLLALTAICFSKFPLT